MLLGLSQRLLLPAGLPASGSRVVTGRLAAALERAAEAAHPPVGSLLGADSGLAGHGAGFLQVPHVVRESELRRRHGRAVDIRSGAEPGTPQAAPQ